MRSQQERDEQALDIVSAVFGAALLLGLPFVVIVGVVAATDAAVSARSGAVAGVLVGALYVATVVVLRRRRR